MAESIVQLPAPTVKMHSWNRTIGANSVEDEFTVPGEYPMASYTASAGNTLTATANSHLGQLMAGASLNVYVRRIIVRPGGTLPAAVTRFAIQLLRLTTAGTGGTAFTPRPLDSSDAAAGATMMTLPTVKGTEGVTIDEESMWMNTAALPGEGVYQWVQSPNAKALRIPAGTTNGIVVKNPAALAAASVTVYFEFVELNY